MELMPKSLSANIEHKPDGTAVARFTAYALALMATRERGGGVEVAQEAEWTAADSDHEAHAEGMETARRKWPPADGWSHQVAVRKVNVALDLLKKE